jgi:hypothetical protein
MNIRGALSHKGRAMARIYVSSTFVDLREHRAKVIETLRQLGHDVVAMENYVADVQIPLEKCLDDVSSCDMYVGVFGWRYGYIPDDDAMGLSITEYEYRCAEQKEMPRLVFILDESLTMSTALHRRIHWGWQQGGENTVFSRGTSAEKVGFILHIAR